MMGNLSPGLKNHAVTMFEVGKLNDESLDGFLNELDRVQDVGEGEARRYYEHAVNLRDTLRFLRYNTELAAGEPTHCTFRSSSVVFGCESENARSLGSKLCEISMLVLCKKSFPSNFAFIVFEVTSRAVCNFEKENDNTNSVNVRF